MQEKSRENTGYLRARTASTALPLTCVRLTSVITSSATQVPRNAIASRFLDGSRYTSAVHCVDECRTMQHSSYLGGGGGQGSGWEGTPAAALSARQTPHGSRGHCVPEAHVWRCAVRPQWNARAHRAPPGHLPKPIPNPKVPSWDTDGVSIWGEGDT